MQRLDSKPDASLSRIWDQSRNAIRNHLPSLFKANPGRAADNQRQRIGVQRGGLVHGAKVVLDILSSFRLSGRREHPSATDARYMQLCIVHKTNALG
jgi:hypothetical protein